VFLTVGRNLITSHPQPTRGDEETYYRVETIGNIFISTKYLLQKVRSENRKTWRENYIFAEIIAKLSRSSCSVWKAKACNSCFRPKLFHEKTPGIKNLQTKIKHRGRIKGRN